MYLNKMNDIEYTAFQIAYFAQFTESQFQLTQLHSLNEHLRTGVSENTESFNCVGMELPTIVG